MGYYAAIRKAEAREFDEKLKAAAFTAWRIESMLASMFSENFKGPAFQEYLDAHGLLSYEERQEYRALKIMQKIQREREAKAAQTLADQIMAADKLRAQSLKGKGGS